MRYSKLPLQRYIPGQTRRPKESLALHELSDQNCWEISVERFNHSYYWEAHESLEELWNRSDRQTSPAGLLYQVLIHLSAAQLKVFYQHKPHRKSILAAEQKLTQLENIDTFNECTSDLRLQLAQFSPKHDALEQTRLQLHQPCWENIQFA